MIYTFDKNSLEFKKVRYVNVAKRYVLPLLIIIPLLSISIVSQHEYEDVVYVQVDKKTFNEENLKQMIYNMNLKFPHIAMAQAILSFEHPLQTCLVTPCCRCQVLRNLLLQVRSLVTTL